MSKQSDMDKERLESARRVIFGVVAKQHLYPYNDDVKDVETIHTKDINGHAGAVKKDIRLLKASGDIYANGTQFRLYGNAPIFKVVNFRTDSQAYEVLPVFRHTMRDLCNEVFAGYRYRNMKVNSHEMDLVGYRAIRDLNSSEAIYVYWHQDEFFIYEDYIYLKSLEVTRVKAALRAIVEVRLGKDYKEKVAAQLGLPRNAINKLEEIEMSFRNFALYPSTLTEESFKGAGGFFEEYTHRLSVMEALHKNLTKFWELVQAAGGTKLIIREFRKEIIEDLLQKAPLYLNKKNLDLDDPITAQVSVSKFILNYASNLNYEYLYEDVSIEHINEHNRCRKELPFKLFEPDGDELLLVGGIDGNNIQRTRPSGTPKPSEDISGGGKEKGDGSSTGGRASELISLIQTVRSNTIQSSTI